MFVDAGWSKEDISQALVQRTTRSTAWVKSNGWMIGGRYERGGAIEPGDESRELAIAAPANNLHVVTCGGPAGNFPVYLYTYSHQFEIASVKIG